MNNIDKKAVINVFNSIGIRVANDSIETERLDPKINQAGSRPILVKLKSQNESLVTDILKAAKLLKDQHDFKHISISRDLFKEQRQLEKKLISVRRDLNKELRENIPTAAFYFTIHNGKIVKGSKYNKTAQNCNEMVKNLLCEAINEFKADQTKSSSTTSVISLSLLNKVIDAKNQTTDFHRISRMSEKITFHAINNYNII